MTEHETQVKAIEARLSELGFTFKAECVDAGTYNRASKWNITLSHSPELDGSRPTEYTTEYTSGYGNRKWKRGCPVVPDGGPLPTGIKHGKPYYMGGRLVLMAAEMLETQTESIVPRLADIAYCLLMDAQTTWYGQSFEDWCGELGYDTDSRKAERSFNDCRDTADYFRRTGVDFDTLQELFQDY